METDTEFLFLSLMLTKANINTDFEALYFQLRIGNQVANFVTAYKLPSSNNIEFLTKLEDFLFAIRCIGNPKTPT